MAQIIDFPKPDKEKKKKEPRNKNKYKADKSAKLIVYLGLSVSLAVLTVGTVLNKSRQVVKKARKRLRE